MSENIHNLDEKLYSRDIANEEQKKAIAEIEKFDIGTYQKVELILVLLGAKEGTEVSFYKWNGPSKNVLDILTSQCHFFVVKKENIKNDAVLEEYAVSKNFETAQKLAILDPSKDHKEFGKIMGFPETAVQAFVEGTMLEEEETPNMDGNIFSFRLSKGYWQEELKTLRHWNDLIKKYSPSLYAELGGK